MLYHIKTCTLGTCLLFVCVDSIISSYHHVLKNSILIKLVLTKTDVRDGNKYNQFWESSLSMKITNQNDIFVAFNWLTCLNYSNCYEGSWEISLNLFFNK